MKRMVAIDYGKARIGLAIESPVGSFAMPWKTISHDKEIQSTIDKLMKQFEETQIECLIIGLPLHLSGEESDLSLEVRKFAELLKKATSIPIIFWDERLTSKQADSILRESKMKRKQRDQISDPIAATLILQSYIDSLPK